MEGASRQWALCKTSTDAVRVWGNGGEAWIIQASSTLIRNVNFSLWLVIPKSGFQEQIHEMLLGQRVPQSYKLGRPHSQLLLPKSLP